MRFDPTSARKNWQRAEYIEFPAWGAALRERNLRTKDSTPGESNNRRQTEISRGALQFPRLKLSAVVARTQVVR